jgi:hypothetical protein
MNIVALCVDSVFGALVHLHVVIVQNKLFTVCFFS